MWTPPVKAEVVPRSDDLWWEGKLERIDAYMVAAEARTAARWLAMGRNRATKSGGGR